MASKRKAPSKTKIDRLRTTMKVERTPLNDQTQALERVAPDEAVGRILAMHVVPDAADEMPVEHSNNAEQPVKKSLLKRVLRFFLR